MKAISALLHNTSHTKPFEAEEFLSDAAMEKVHLLYFSPKLNTSGYYRMLAPCLELAKTPFFNTHIMGLNKEDFNTPFEFTTASLDDEWILWADYMIFPILTKDFLYFFKACKVINPELQLVMDVDVLLHHLPGYDPMQKKISGSMLTAFEANLNQVDIITSPNEHILNFYQDFLKGRYSHSTPFFAQLPNLISETGYQGIEAKAAQNNATVRIGIVVNPRYTNDLLIILAPLLAIQKKYADKVSFVVYGWSGVLQDGSKPLAELNITYHKAVSIMDHLQKLSELRLDIALIPVQNKASRRLISEIPYLELASLGIPVIASRHSIFKEYILDGATGNLANGASQWQQLIAKHIEDKDYRKAIGEAAKAYVWEHYGYTEDNLQLFKELYF